MAGKFEKVNTFTGSSVASLTLGSIFSADYNFYNVYIRGGMTGVSDIAAERPKLKVLTAAGAEFSTGIYDFTSFELNGSSITDNNANGIITTIDCISHNQRFFWNRSAKVQTR